MVSSAVFSGIALVLAWVLKWMLVKENRKIVSEAAGQAVQLYVW